MAISHYRCAVSTQLPFPDDHEEQDLATQTWSIACEQKGVDIEFDEAALTLVTARGAQCRGELKTKARPLIEGEYGLAAPSNKTQLLSNRNRVKDLLTRAAFTYENPTTRSGIYENPVLQRIINEMWFANQKDEGVVYSGYFSPRLSLITLALVLTVIQNVLEEWATGKRKSISFTKKLYYDKFEAHLSTLEDFAERTKRYRMVPMMLTTFLTRARENADATLEEGDDAAKLDGEDVENAVKDWMERHGLDGDANEGGEHHRAGEWPGDGVVERDGEEVVEQATE